MSDDEVALNRCSRCRELGSIGHQCPPDVVIAERLRRQRLERNAKRNQIRRAERAVIMAAIRWSKVPVDSWGGTGVPGIISDSSLGRAVERLLKAREK